MLTGLTYLSQSLCPPARQEGANDQRMGESQCSCREEQIFRAFKYGRVGICYWYLKKC